MSTTPSDRSNRLAHAFLLAFAAALPHSISVAQITATLAALVWVIGLVAGRRRPERTPLDLPILLFVAASILAALFSLEPRISLAKLAGTVLILIAPVTAGILRTRRQVWQLVAVLLASAALSAGLVVWEKIVGRGVDIVAVAPGSPFERAGVKPRDVILACDGKPIEGPAHFDRLLAEHDPEKPLTCQALRTGVKLYQFTVPADDLGAGSSPDTWGYRVKTGRGIRARGTYSHFVTYAEVMLQLAALALGLWLAYPRKRAPAAALLLALALLLVAALAATFTRASWAALALAALAMISVKVGRRARLALLVAAPLVALGLNTLLVEWRGVGFYNRADKSIQYRELMWADGLRLIREHPLLGVGMDTILLRWRELGLRAYEEMRLHSHFHSTPIQLGVERGLVGLVAWLLLIVVYVRLLVRRVKQPAADDWRAHGLVLGLFGAATGFLASSLVHYNFGDSEVAMLLWLLAGTALALDRLSLGEARGE
ncbi:MAG: O-antigen ligase family protein [Acidobacteria bacterium]|nr:O-antigen ligase family protein [Acidobacteriota bacterium]